MCLLKGLKLLNQLKQVRRVINIDKKNTDTLVQQTKTSPREILERKIKRWKQSFSFKKPLELEKDKWMKGVTNSEVFNSIFNLKEKNKNIINFRPDYWDDITTIHRIKFLIAAKSDMKTEIKHRNEIQVRKTSLDHLFDLDYGPPKENLIELLEKQKNNKVLINKKVSTFEETLEKLVAE